MGDGMTLENEVATLRRELKDVSESLRQIRDANRLQSRRVSAEAPDDNDLMGWNATTKKWEPKSDSPTARVANSVSISHTTSGAWETLTFDSERYDTDTIHSTSSDTGRLTATTAGKYIIVANVRFASNSTGDRGLRFRLGGSTIIAQDVRRASAGAVTVIALTTQYDLAATNYVEVQGFQDSGGALNMEVSAEHSPEFMMARLGPTGGAPDFDHGDLTGLSDTADHEYATLKDGTRAFLGNQSMGTFRLTNLSTPTDTQDAATKQYVDDNAGGGSTTIHGESLHTGDVLPDADQSTTGSLTIQKSGAAVTLKTAAGDIYMQTFAIGASGAWSFFGGGSLLMFSDSGATRKGVWLGASGGMRLGDSVNPAEILEVAGNALVTGTLKPQSGILLDEQATPSSPPENTGHLFTRANGSSIDLVFRTSTGAECVICSELDTTVTPPGATMLMMGVQTA